MLNVIIIGALSAVAEATGRLYAEEGANLTLAARDAAGLEALAADLRVRGAASVTVERLDLATAPTEEIDRAVERWFGAMGRVDHVILAYGVLGDQADGERDISAAAASLNVNFQSAALWSLKVADKLEAQGSGSLVVIGSVAGDRGRRINYIYGAAKAGLATLVQGLAHRLSASGVRVVIVKPGSIDSPMTAHLPKTGPLWSTPAAVARHVRRAADRGGVVQYAPGYWRIVMLILRVLPTPLFHRTRF